jgi:hypothetical protein
MPQNEQGTALVSNTAKTGDYLCFKDCRAIALVRLKGNSGNTYVVTGRACIYDLNLKLEDWTVGVM